MYIPTVIVPSPHAMKTRTAMTAVLHAGIKQGWLSQDLLFPLRNALPLVQGGETNGLDLERAENSL